MNRRDFIKTIGLACAGLPVSAHRSACGGLAGTGSTSERRRPNFVVIFCDDLGYGDLACFGHPTIRTPNLDRMAGEGQRWTSFYAGASVCTPSRAALLTGRLPVRSGMCSNVRRVLFPDSAGGLPQSEVTIARALKPQSYTTACIGKWHLGHLPQYLPTSHGFDSYFGIPYSNDMDRVGGEGRQAFWAPKIEYWNVPLMRDEEIVERPADQNTITKRYAEEAVRFIEQKREEPFFLYLAHNLPHVPLFCSDEFRGTSLRGLYGDVVEEIDAGVGRILETLKKHHLAENTLVVFTSDNGPWLTFNEHGGSAGLLREGKGCTYEGGMREPTIFWWPGRIQPGVVRDMGATMDLYTTILKLAGAEVPSDRVVDGLDLTPALFGTGPSPRRTMFYYRGTELFAVRKGPYKAHFITQSGYGSDKPVRHDPPVLYHLEHDPSEKYDVAKDHPDVIADIVKEVEKHRATLTPAEDQLAKRIQKEG
ncbi:MAG: sulfatase [Sedimentisphaerales bacterium]|jgi:arylsulfatase A-like enzyme|nr:sulfatase [Planctomycetota bacterium]MDY0356539.1 sulfatase [Sedimentisphaerales bacterium]NLT78659.1 sulfatase [Planctomycetota bacterium]